MDSLEIALAAAQAFRKIDPTIGAQTVEVFLTIAQRDGQLMISELEDACGLIRSSASRNVKLLSSKKLKDGRHGYGLIYVRSSPTDERVKMLYLTEAGRQMVNHIADAIEARKGKRNA